MSQFSSHVSNLGFIDAWEIVNVWQYSRFFFCLAKGLNFMMAARLNVIAGHFNPLLKENNMATRRRSPVTSHVLDVALGKPAQGVPLELAIFSGSSWITVGTGVTDQDGRCSGLMTEGQTLSVATYRLHFDTKTYFLSQNIAKPFYPYAEIVFEVHNPIEHYHIPLLLAPFSYSTYRGSWLSHIWAIQYWRNCWVKF